MEVIEPSGTASSETGCDAASEGSEKARPDDKPVSEAKLRANMENAKKSTGPKTPAGKSRTRFNAVKHGLCSRRVIYNPDGQLEDEGLKALLDDLRLKYGNDDVRTELLVESLVVEYWRGQQAVEQEIDFLKNGGWHFGPQGNVRNLERYRTAGQKNFFRLLELLDARAAELQSPEPAADSSQVFGEPETKKRQGRRY